MAACRSAYDVEDLDLYYTDCVIGGPGAFMIPVNDWSQFPEAIRRKLVLELAGPASRLWAAEQDEGRPLVLGAGAAVVRLPDRRKAVARPELDVGQAGEAATSSAAHAASSCLRSTRSCCGERE